MNKKDLKNLMVVLTRNRELYVKIDDKLIGNGFIPLDDYNEDLSCYDDNEYDIIKIYEPKMCNLVKMLDLGYLQTHTLLWERPTLNSIEESILEYAYDQGYIYITRDEDNEIYVWTSKPYKDVNEWLLPDEDSGNMQSLTLFSKLFKFIKFEDDTPVSISSLL